MDDVVRASLGSRAGVTFVMSAFALLALLLSVIGLYGTIAESVAQRRREIGVRMALGSRRFAILGLVLRRGLVLAGTGTVMGMVGAAGATRALESLLFGVRPIDLPTFLTVAGALLAIAAAACAVPALRASRIDPMVTLRD
jgi:ABC-type antimicrobial peptide transport system permease subunit